LINTGYVCVTFDCCLYTGRKLCGIKKGISSYHDTVSGEMLHKL